MTIRSTTFQKIRELLESYHTSGEYVQGHYAFHAGLKADANPFDKNLQKEWYTNWQKGWQDASRNFQG